MLARKQQGGAEDRDHQLSIQTGIRQKCLQQAPGWEAVGVPKREIEPGCPLTCGKDIFACSEVVFYGFLTVCL